MVGQTQESALDLGPHKTAPGTQRFCAATGAVRPVDEMIRFVMSPDGVAVPDLKRRLPGRGMWITATRQALHAALERNAFARAFKRDVRVTPDVVDTTERLIERTARRDRLPDRRGLHEVGPGAHHVENSWHAPAR